MLPWSQFFISIAASIQRSRTASWGALIQGTCTCKYMRSFQQRSLRATHPNVSYRGNAAEYWSASSACRVSALCLASSWSICSPFLMCLEACALQSKYEILVCLLAATPEFCSWTRMFHIWRIVVLKKAALARRIQP